MQWPSLALPDYFTQATGTAAHQHPYQQFLDWLALLCEDVYNCLAPRPHHRHRWARKLVMEKWRCVRLPLCLCASVPLCLCASVPLCLCMKLSTFFPQRSFHVGRGRVFRKVQFDFSYSYFGLGSRNIQRLVLDRCIEEAGKRRVSLWRGAEFSEKITLMPILDGCNMVGVDQRKEVAQQPTFELASRQKRISCEYF